MLSSISAVVMQLLYVLVGAAVLVVTNFAIIYNHIYYIALMFLLNTFTTILRLMHKSNIIFLTWVFAPLVFSLVYPSITGEGIFIVSRLMAFITFVYCFEAIPLFVALILRIFCGFFELFASKTSPSPAKPQELPGDQKPLLDTKGKQKEPAKSMDDLNAVVRIMEDVNDNGDNGASPSRPSSTEKSRNPSYYAEIIPLKIYNFSFEYHVQILFAVAILVPQFLLHMFLMILEWIASLHSCFMFSSEYLSGIASSMTHVVWKQTSTGDKLITNRSYKAKGGNEMPTSLELLNIQR